MTRYQVLLQAIKKAGRMMKQAKPDDGVQAKDEKFDMVTATDLESQRIITDMIKSNFPDDLILSEESHEIISNPLIVPHLWVVDPIDGTRNFRYQRNYCAVSIGYVENGVTKSSAVFNPFHDDLYTAQKGNGAFRNGRKIAVSNTEDIHISTIETDNSYDSDKTTLHLQLLLKLQPIPWIMMRGSSVMTMCEVADGKSDLYFSTSVKPWDNAAAFLILQEAGGVTKGFVGEEISFLSSSVVAGNQKLVNQFISAIQLIN